MAQWKALIARDRGCVVCGAEPSRCEAHHIVPWEIGGPTDIDNLVLLCVRCHHDVHDRGMELRHHDGLWTIVASTSPASGRRCRHGPASRGDPPPQADTASLFGLTA